METETKNKRIDSLKRPYNYPPKTLLREGNTLDSLVAFLDEALHLSDNIKEDESYAKTGKYNT